MYAFASRETFELSVFNAGPPIPPASLGQLFQPFFRGAVRPSQQGLGLGLYIVSEIARAHGGTIDVRSTDVETCFTFKMPNKSA
jgi:signal transduction histidine kinase